MENKQIVIKDYFNILRDGYGRIYCIQEIGDPKSLIKAIREQNEYIQAKEQECEELKTLLNAKEQKLIKIKQYIEDNEWCILDEMYKDLEQIIESKEGGNYEAK